MEQEKVPHAESQFSPVDKTHVEEETSPVTQKIAELLQDERRIETLDDLNFAVEHHSPLLHKDRILALVSSIPPAFAGLPQTRFLKGVVHYHLQHKKLEGEKDWKGAYEQFSAMLPEAEAGDFLGFYIPNYCFLSLRNHDSNSADLESLFQKAKEGAESMQEPIRSQLLGFVLYNYGRLLIKQKHEAEAAKCYIDAGNARVSFYKSIKSSADSVELLSAATQVWKIREEWTRSLPATDIELCPVSEALFAEVAQLADPTFANKTK